MGGGPDTVRLARAIVVGDDGHDAVVEAEYRHEDKALQLEIGGKDRHGGGVEGPRILFMPKVITEPMEDMIMDGTPTA